MVILGVSCYYHDAAAALLIDGQLVAAAEEERFTRKKHDASFPRCAIEFCLRQAGLAARDLDYVVFYEKPLVKFERVLMTVLGTFPRSAAVFRESMIAWFNEKLWIKSQLVKHFGLKPAQVLFVDHHLSHAASAFFCSPFEEAAILTVDGVGEWTTAAVGRGCASWAGTGGNALQLEEDIRFPHSLGLLYSAFTAFLGFEVNDGEYKVMGMAPYGEPCYVDRVHRLVRVYADGSFQLDMDYFSYLYSTQRTYNRKFETLWGEARDPRAEFVTRRTQPAGDTPGAVVEKNQYYADVAASIQLVTEDILLKMARRAHERTGSRYLCLAGGVALNSVANGRIVKEAGFDNVYIQPAAGDSGGALGAALYAYHVLLGQPRRFVMEHAYWGEGYSDDQIEAALREAGLYYDVVPDPERMQDKVVEALLRGQVVGWFQGRFEWGPRALGHRSLLADPRRAEMKDTVNLKIKFREPFRPFAPVVLEHRAAEFFDLADAARNYPARFMLLVAPVHAHQQATIPAVTHVDGTGRLQTIRQETNAGYYSVVEKFGQATGVPVLLNTSFNLRGEPIVASPQDAIGTFRRSGIDVLAMGSYFVCKAAT